MERTQLLLVHLLLIAHLPQDVPFLSTYIQRTYQKPNQVEHSPFGKLDNPPLSKTRDLGPVLKYHVATASNGEEVHTVLVASHVASHALQSTGAMPNVIKNLKKLHVENSEGT